MSVSSGNYSLTAVHYYLNPNSAEEWQYVVRNTNTQTMRIIKDRAPLGEFGEEDQVEQLNSKTWRPLPQSESKSFFETPEVQDLIQQAPEVARSVVAGHIHSGRHFLPSTLGISKFRDSDSYFIKPGYTQTVKSEPNQRLQRTAILMDVDQDGIFDLFARDSNAHRFLSEDALTENDVDVIVSRMPLRVSIGEFLIGATPIPTQIGSIPFSMRPEMFYTSENFDSTSSTFENLMRPAESHFNPYAVCDNES